MKLFVYEELFGFDYYVGCANYVHCIWNCLK